MLLKDLKIINLENLFIYNYNCYIGIYLELFLIISLSLLIVFLVIIDNFFNYKFILSSISSNLMSLILLLLFILNNNNEITFYTFDYLLVSNNFTILVKNILLISLFFCILISNDYIKKEKIVQYEYFLLIGLSFLGIITIVSANDLISFYLAIELQSLSFYILAAIKIYNNFSTEAGLKYFILGAFSSGLLLFGCSLIYGITGCTNFSDLQLLFFNNDIPNDYFNGFLLGMILITIGLLFKLGAAPFHMWLPDVYEGVPTIVTAIFSIVPKIAIFSLFFRISLNLFSGNFFFWHQLLIYSSIISIILGTLGALYQVKIKRLLAYSAISHVGFLLIGFSLLNSFSLFALFFYLIIYIIISINLFSLLLNIRKWDNNLKLKKINEFTLLFKSNSLLAINFCLILFSIAGIPPLIGFYSKFYIFVSAIKSNLYIVAIIAAIFSVIASMYYLRMIKLMFFKNFSYWLFLTNISSTVSFIITLTLFLNLIFVFNPEFAIIFIYNNILNLFY